MKRNLLFLSVLLLTLSCSNRSKEKNHAVQVIHVDVSVAPQKIDLEDVTENISFIRLETNSNCLIKSINKVEIYKSRIYILESSAFRNLLCFNLQGKFLFKVSGVGQGPGEYQFLTDFTIDKENGCLLLADNFRKIMKFDLEGNYVETYKTDLAINNIYLVDEKENIMAIRGYSAQRDNHYSFVTYSLKDQSILYYKSSDYVNIISSIGSNVFSQSKNGILYSEPFNDTLFYVTKAGMEPCYIIDFGKYTFPIKEYKNEQLRSLIMQFNNSDKKYAGLISNSYESSKCLFFGYDFSGKGLLAIYSTEADKTVSINEIIIKGNSYSKIQAFFKMQQDGTFIAELPAELVSNEDIFMKESQREGYGSYTDITNLTIREDDNPILILGELNFDRLF